jgi:tRNA(Ile)-lysidine synthase
MRDRVLATISRYSMLQPGMRLGVAVSGGADSVCLLHFLRDILANFNLNLTVVHLNHRLRAEADLDEQFVLELADRFHLAKRTQVVDVRQLAESTGDNLEQAARNARRDFFHRLIAAGDVDRIATAHTRSDQAETVLFRLLRGAYTTGLSGIRPVTAGGLIRPFLEIDRADVLAYLREREIAWREDSSNQNLDFVRNRIRHQLLPELAAGWNPNLPAILAQLAVLSQEDDEFWNAEIDRLAPKYLTRSQDEPAILIDIPDFLTLPRTVARRLVRLAISQIRGDLTQVDFGHIGRIMALADAPDGHGRLQIPGVDVFRSFDWLRFAIPRREPPIRDWEIPLVAPGTYAIPGGELRLELIERTDASTGGSGLRHLDWSRTQPLGALQLRNWRPGDRYHPADRSRPDKIKALFQEARIPLWERSAWPVLCAGAHIVWSRRFGPAVDLAAGPGARRVLQIDEFRPKTGASP